MIKIFEVINPDWGIAFKRISLAMHAYAPEEIQWTSYDDCDIMLVHVVGPGEVQWLNKPKPKIILQQCYFTAQSDKIDYPLFWKNALLTVSFHNLNNYTDKNFNFYHMPYGAKSSLFKYMPEIKKENTIFTTGEVYETEGLDKIFNAVKTIKGTMIHTGNNFGWDTTYYKNFSLLPDSKFVQLLNSCKYVSALRFIEGFELLGVEGLMCKLRPIIPENDTYNWYRKYAYTIDTKQDIHEQLVSILSQAPRPFTDEEYNEIIATFDWKVIIDNFFKKIQNTL